MTRALFQLGGILLREQHSSKALGAFVEATRSALDVTGEGPLDVGRDEAQILADIAIALIEARSHVHAWEATRCAIEIELRLDRKPWLDELDSRVAMLRALFPALIAEGKADQAAETIPLSRKLRELQAEVLSPDELVTELESLLRGAKLLHTGLRNIEAWPLLQEAAAMRPRLMPPVRDRITLRLADQLIESALVFYCSSRSAMAIQAMEMISALHQELVEQASGYAASELLAMLDKLPPALQRIALATERNMFEDHAALDAERNPRNPIDGQGQDHGDERRPRILIVDDSALMLDMAKEALELAGYSVDIAQVLSQITDEDRLRSFDLILMDVVMPELQGDDVAMVLRGEIEGFTAPIYLLSGLAENELAERAKQAGIEGYISKADGIDALVQRVHELLSTTA